MVRNWIILSVSNTVQYVGESVTLINCTVPEPSRKKVQSDLSLQACT